MRYHLLIDADDTLWENNVYFEQATHQFLTFLNHSRLSHAEVQAVIDEVEHGMGYGSASFTRSLLETYRRLAERDVREEDLEQIRSFGASIRAHPMELMDGVADTLDDLASRHDLLLLTKGDPDEQTFKVEDSGLQKYFRAVLVVPEKDVAAYRDVVRDTQVDPQQTWMIGNSPRSDINPALTAGLRAVYIPHPQTWHLEHEEVYDPGDGRLLTLARFAELRDHF